MLVVAIVSSNAIEYWIRLTFAKAPSTVTVRLIVSPAFAEVTSLVSVIV